MDGGLLPRRSGVALSGLSLGSLWKQSPLPAGSESGRERVTKTGGFPETLGDEIGPGLDHRPGAHPPSLLLTRWEPATQMPVRPAGRGSALGKEVHRAHVRV